MLSSQSKLSSVICRHAVPEIWQQMWKAGPWPVPAEQLPTGTIIVKEIKAPAPAVGLYARVSSSEPRKDWEAQ